MDISQRGEVLSLLIFITYFYKIIKRLVLLNNRILPSFTHSHIIQNFCSNFVFVVTSFPRQAL